MDHNTTMYIYIQILQYNYVYLYLYPVKECTFIGVSAVAKEH